MPTIAAIDVGSNAIRLAIGRTEADGKVQVLRNLREPVRLGQDVFTQGTFTEETARRATAAFVKFRKLLDRYQVDQVRAVATSAMRESLNRDMLIDRIARAADINVGVISAAEEAGLVYLAVTNAIDLEDTTAMLVDVGGGSVEVTLLLDGTILAGKSLKLGTVRMLQIINESEDGIIRFRRLVQSSVHSVQEMIQKHLGETPIAYFIATGGNAEALEDLGSKALSLPTNTSLPAWAMDDLVRLLEGMSPTKRRNQLKLKHDRADVVLPAAIVLQALMGAISAPVMRAPKVGLKDGVLLDMAHAQKRKQRVSHENVLDAARALEKKYQPGDPHGENTRRFALQLFNDTHHLHHMDDEAALLLEVSSLLHDIGRYVNVAEHHLHSFYLIKSEPITGLTEAQQHMVATISRYHRKASPSVDHPEYASLTPKDRGIVSKLAAILRVADGLDAELSGKISGFTTEISGRNMVVQVIGEGDLLMEKWVLIQKASLFRDVFGLRVVVEQQRRDIDVA